jgi:hypothetical protein
MLPCTSLHVAESMRAHSSDIGIAGKCTLLSSFGKPNKLHRRGHHDWMAPSNQPSPHRNLTSWARLLKERFRSTIAGSPQQNRIYSHRQLFPCLQNPWNFNILVTPCMHGLISTFLRPIVKLFKRVFCRKPWPPTVEFGADRQTDRQEFISKLFGK